MKTRETNGRPSSGGRLVRETLRAAVLRVLAERPSHGYAVIKRIEEATLGCWRPTPGTLYPLLEQLEAEGVIERAGVETAHVKSGRRVKYRLSRKGWEELASIVMFKARLRPFYTTFQVVDAIELLRKAGYEAEAREACRLFKEGLRRLLERLREACPEEDGPGPDSKASESGDRRRGLGECGMDELLDDAPRVGGR
ncbi:MAG: PadR family transcriptional regulator [Desulfurococcales archaeon]|nr:PadR family transcriptional regulator [Desulfurococcales archaeon]